MYSGEIKKYKLGSARTRKHATDDNLSSNAETPAELFAPLRSPIKEFHETLLSLISLNDPSGTATLLRYANTLSYIHGLSGSNDIKA